MSMSPERELEQWASTWRMDEGPRPAPDAIRHYVQRRSRLLVTWLVGEVVIGVGGATWLVRRLVVESDPVDKAAMGLLAVVAAGAVLLSWRTWHRVISVSGGTTAAHLELAAERARRLRLALRAGRWILASEVAVFTPWIWHRLYAGVPLASPQAQFRAWGVLAIMTAVGAVGLHLAHRWQRRDQRTIEELRHDFEDV